MVRIWKIFFSACHSHKSNYSEALSARIIAPQLSNFMPIILKPLIRNTLRIFLIEETDSERMNFHCIPSGRMLNTKGQRRFIHRTWL